MAHSDDKHKKHYFNETRGMTYTDFPQNTRESHMKDAKVKPKVIVSQEMVEGLGEELLNDVLGPTWEQVDAELPVEAPESWIELASALEDEPPVQA